MGMVMSEMKVRIETIEPMTVARVHAMGEEPETTAWAKLVKWAGPRGYLESMPVRRIFGFNNPGPSVGSPHYGYEFWIQMDAGAETGDPSITLTRFQGGLYAVAPFTAETPMDLPVEWQKFAQWRGTSRYAPGSHQWLEEHSPEGKVLAMLLPIGR
jgi:DNA gyrase inhibitor GyrI